MGIHSGLLLSLWLTLFALHASGANFLGFNTGPFYSIVGTADASTVPIALQVVFDGPVAANTFVSIISSDPSRLVISGGGVIIPAGQSSATVLVSSYALGNVTVMGYFWDVVATNTVRVVAQVPVIPQLTIELLSGAMRLTWPTNATGYLLESNSVPSNPAGWGVLTSNYSILNTNFVVTNASSGPAKFYRLHMP